MSTRSCAIRFRSPFRRIEDFMPPLAAAAIALIMLVAVFTGVWAWQLKSKNAGMIDPVWAISLGWVAVLYAVLGNGDLTTRIIVGAGGFVWGLRLGLHLWKRNAGHDEDPRYRKFREQWGARANPKMFAFFQLQVVISMLVSISFIVPAYRVTAPGTVGVLLAVLVWIGSITGEALADLQLRRFKADNSNKGKVCRAGLWRYSRHPNYFFECVHWVAYIPLAVGTGPWIIAMFLPPVLMAWLPMRVSGVPMVEAASAKKREDHARYMRTTDTLIPCPPRHS
jgi:steroid 5-alpha reductase family enzyme